MRSLAIDNTFDNNVYDGQFENQYMFGSSFLVMPFEGSTTFGRVYFPKGNWYDLYSGALQNGNSQKIIPVSMSKLPVYVKESSIIPMQSLIQTTAQKPTDTLTVHIYKGAVNNRFVYYEDDGESYKYENGAFYKREISYDAAASKITFGKAEGSLNSKFTKLKIILHGFDNSSVKVNGNQTIVNNDYFSYLLPISKFDPQGAAGTADAEKVKSMVINNDSNALSIIY